MQLNDLLGSPLIEAERRIKEMGLSSRVKIGKAPRDAMPEDSSQLRVMRARMAGDLVELVVVHPPALELPE